MNVDEKEEHKKHQVIVIKKTIKKAGHHGGSWKIAYADFVTAMMAFFLLMWLLSMLNKYQLMGISNYFKKPLKHVFIENKKNDNEIKKIPQEDIKKFNAISNIKSMDKDQYLGSSEKTKKIAQSKTEAENSQETRDIKNLKRHLEAKLQQNAALSPYKNQLNFKIVKEGLKINLHDLENKPMFSLGKTDFEAYAKPILIWLGEEIRKSNYKIMIIGFTDTYQYDKDNNYSNWELSSDRANATRRTLIKYGVNEQQMIRISGAADSVLLNKKIGSDPMNRRIEIILLNKEAEKRLLSNE